MSRSIYDKTNKVRIPISGAEIPNVDSSLSTTSENPVQNKVITNCVNDISNIYGAKNLIPYDYLTSSQVVNGVTVTPLGDGTYKLNGTATSFTDIRLSPWGTSSYDTCLTLEKGIYILSGTPISSGSGGTGKANMWLVANDGTNRSNAAFDYGDGYTLNHSNTAIKYEVKISVPQGITLSDVVFKPMLRLASIQDDIYVPYAKTNKELTDDIRTINTSVSQIEEFIASPRIPINPSTEPTEEGSIWITTT